MTSPPTRSSIRPNAGRADEFAVGDADAFTVDQGDEAGVLRHGLLAAIEDESGQADVLGIRRGKNWIWAAGDQPGGARNAIDLNASREV